MVLTHNVYGLKIGGNIYFNPSCLLFGNWVGNRGDRGGYFHAKKSGLDPAVYSNHNNDIPNVKYYFKYIFHDKNIS